MTGDEAPTGATTDEGTAEDTPDERPAPETAPDTTAAPADPGDEAGAEAGAAPTDEPVAADDYGDPDAHVGDFTSPDVDLSHLTPTDDGDPDDDEQDPAPEDLSAGQPGEHGTVAWDETDPGLPVSQP